MYRYCADCENLNTKDSKGEGVYKCKKRKQYVYAHTEACENFDKNY